MATAAAIYTFASRYVTGLRVRDDRLEIATAVPYKSPHLVALTRIRSAERRRGRSGQGTALPVDAPWISLRVDGFWLPFVVDLQSEVVNVPGIQALLPPNSRPGSRPSLTRT
jgi:hypothetical protein